MQALSHQPIQPSADSVKSEGDRTPFASQTVTISKAEYIQLKWEAEYYKAQFEQASKRIAALEKELETSQAANRDLKQRLYGKKSEKSSGQDKVDKPEQSGPKKKRGHQQGAKGHGRTPRPNLPVVEEIRDLADDDKCCPHCGEAFLPFPGFEEADIIEIHVRSHIRHIKRPRYQKGCQCPQTPGIITAPPAPRLIPKSPVGVSVWTEVLLGKFHHARPLNRICADFKHHGLPLAQGTLTDGLQRIAPLFEPLMEAFYLQQMSETLFHNDETGWKVFEQLEGKTGYRWWLWATRSVSVVIFRVSPTRGAETPTIHFAAIGELEIVLVCDRYVVYKCLAKNMETIILAFCWAHVRRDFLDAARSYPELEARMLPWVEDIGELYHHNELRLLFWDDELPLTEQSKAFQRRHTALTDKLSQMEERRTAYLADKELHHAERKVLESLKNHWEGLTHFVERPEIPMDNNAAERVMRNPAMGRKNYYGSGSIWSAELAAMMFSVFQTLQLWNINPHHWLYAFLQACAENGGNTPSDLEPFLPWAMTEERKTALSQALSIGVFDSS